MELPVPSPTQVSQEYWQATAASRLELQWCRACQHWVHYPRASCPRCHSTDLESRPVTGRGRVYSHTSIHTAGGFPSYGERVPYTIVLVELEEGPRMIANLLGDDPTTVQIGDPVEVTFEARGEHHLPQFVRAEA